MAVFSASNSFFDNFPTGVLGRLARISVSVGISYFASLSVRKALSSSIPKAGCPGVSDKSLGRLAAARIGNTDYGDLGAKGG